MLINVLEDIMAANDMIARENRRIFDQHGVFVINLMSSPGAGKTTLLERTLAGLKDELAIAVIEGDIRGKDDKPFKYPLMFKVSQAMVINKMDLLGLVDFDIEQVEQAVLALNPQMEIFRLSCKTGEGLDAWLDWLRGQARRSRSEKQPGTGVSEEGW